MTQLRYRLIPLVFLSGYVSHSYAEVPLPDSVLKDNTETFEIACPDNPQQTTIDMNDCIGTKRDAVKSVEAKYLNTARQRISATQDNQTLNAFEAENKAWDILIDTASHATGVEWQGGTIRGVKATDREIALIELRIHNQWQNWLRYEDSTPPVLPEPLFHNVE
ncbi:lysozyme inhibitor LprI family protein [Sodalis sp. RH19]|uniref:lysozyme inhibitor LprI family protein n=1 Tax=unclassified Sodalis (in: enterobacteria) TaxID=2636512 RepID=UPI0039B598CD